MSGHVGVTFCTTRGVLCFKSILKIRQNLSSRLSFVGRVALIQEIVEESGILLRV